MHPETEGAQPVKSRPPTDEGRRRLVRESLNVGNPPNNARELPDVADPNIDCQLELAVDAIQPYEGNPRRAKKRSRNTPGIRW